MDTNYDLSDPQQARAYLSSLSSHVFRMGDTSFLHPDFAVKMANAVHQARTAGLPVTVQSGYRANPTTGSKYDAEGYSLHGYGGAIDVGGIGGAGSPQAQQWAQIAQKNGIYNPYGVDNTAEYNHWQMVPWKLENRPDVQKAIVSAGGDAGKIWNAISPVTQSAASAYTGSTPNSGASPVAQTDWLNHAAGLTPSSKNATKTPAPVTPPSATVQPPAQSSAAPADWLNHAAGIEPAPVVAAPAQGLPTALAAKPDANAPMMLDNGPNGPILRPMTPQEIASRAVKLSQQNESRVRGQSGNVLNDLAEDVPDAAKYAGGQIAGIRAAIGSNFSNSSALAGQGARQLAAGDVLPSGTISDPSTWGAGGAVKTALGTIGALSSPLTGAIHQIVGQPVADATNKQAGEIAEMAAGALAGPLLGRLGSAINTGTGNAILGTLDPETAALAQTARQKFGIPVNAGQMSPSPGIRVASSALNRLPMSGAESDMAAQQSAFNGAVAKTFGENGVNKITPDVMNRARERIGNDFDTVAKNTNIQVDPQFVSDLHSTVNDAGLVLTQPEADIISRQAQNIYDKINQNTGQISGETYQALTRKGSPLDALLNSNNPNIVHAAQGLRDMLDDGLQRSAPPEMQDLLTQARRQWAAMKTIQPLAAKAPTGDVSPALLAGRVNANTGNAMAFGGGGDLGTLARIGQKFLKEPGSSNTTERASTLGAMMEAGKLGVGAMGAGALGINAGMTMPEIATSAAAIPASLLAARGAGSALRSNWLANSLINRSINPSVAQPIPALYAITGPAAVGSALNGSQKNSGYLP